MMRCCCCWVNCSQLFSFFLVCFATLNLICNYLSLAYVIRYRLNNLRHFHGFSQMCQKGEIVSGKKITSENLNVLCILSEDWNISFLWHIIVWVRWNKLNVKMWREITICPKCTVSTTQSQIIMSQQQTQFVNIIYSNCNRSIFKLN